MPKTGRAADTLTICFNIQELINAKQKNPERVFFLGDKTKNPQTIIGKWREIITQSKEELNILIRETETRTDVEAWNWGIRTGLNNEAALDFDWEFLGYGWRRKFGDRAKTEAYRTPNLGFRFVYKTTERDNSNPFKNTIHTEVHNGGYSALGGFAADEEGNKKPYVLYSRYETATDNTIIADTKAWLNEQLCRYDFLAYKCVNALVNKKHIRLAHEQRIAILNFMLPKDFADVEIHDFFRGCYDNKGRDYDENITDAQITSGKTFKERGGKPHPCTAKTQEGGKVSIPLYQIFVNDPEVCKGCSRKKKTTKSDKQDAKEKEIAKILENLRGKYHFKTPTDIQELYYFDTGIYKEAKCHLEAELEELLGANGYSYYIKEIIEHLKRASYTERENFNKFSDGLIPVLNGLLSLKTLKIQDYDPERLFTFKINANFKDGAKCPKFQKFLDETLDPEDQQTLQEYSGYCLMPTFPFHKTMWFIGGGRNGKGTFILTLEEILGIDNCAHLNITQLNGERNFSEYGLYGKLINVSSEPTTSTELETPLIKKLTGGDWIDAEVKNKQHRVRFRNHAKLFVLGNKYPKVNDNTIAFWERVLLLKWNSVFLEGQGQIQDLEKTWLTDSEEVSGILNWMVEGLQRLLINGKFTVSKTQTDTKLEFKRGSNPFSAWLEENCIYGKDYVIPRSKPYDDYKEYCFNLNEEPDGEKKFNAQLRGTPRVQDLETTRKDFPKEKRFWVGLCLKTDQKEQDEKLKLKQVSLDAVNTEEKPQKPLKPQVKQTVFSNENVNQNDIKKEFQTAGVSGVSGVKQEPEKLESEENEVSYTQLACYFCGKGINTNDWKQDGFTENKPAHKECYEDKQKEIANGFDTEVS